jgi:hypothetical protein
MNPAIAMPQVIVPTQPRRAFPNEPATKAVVWKAVSGVVYANGFDLPQVHWGLQFETMYRLRNAIKYAVECRATKPMLRQVIEGIVKRVETDAMRSMNDKVKKNRRDMLQATRDDKFVRDVLAGIPDFAVYLRTLTDDASDAADANEAAVGFADEPRRAVVTRSRAAAAPAVVEVDEEELVGGALPENDEFDADAADEKSGAGVVDEERKIPPLPRIPSTRPVKGETIPKGKVTIGRATSPNKEQEMEERMKAQEAMMTQLMQGQQQMMNQLANMQISRAAPAPERADPAPERADPAPERADNLD